MAVRDVVQAAAGVGGGDKLYVEDVFSTYLYTGNGSARSINNGIDLAGEGGLVWIKARSFTDGGYIHGLWDTERGVATLNNGSSGNGGHLNTAWVGGEVAYNNTLTSFNSNGFSLGTDSSLGIVNWPTTGVYASWTFRKAPKFFSVVTYTGDGTSSRQIAHDLGSTPGFIAIKRTDTNSDWVTSFYAGETFIGRARLNSTDAFNEAAATNNGYIAAPHNADTFGTQDYGGNVSAVNATGGTYVAYLFASNAGGFGDDGEQNVISCGSFTTDSNAAFSVNLGWEPQFVLTKVVTSSETNWVIADEMRGFNAPSVNARVLLPNTSGSEASGYSIYKNATGFSGSGYFAGNQTHIYIAIRRPMKTPESGTEVFAPALAGSAGDGQQPWFRSGFPVDLGMYADRGGSSNNIRFNDRLRGAKELASSSTIGEFAGPGGFDFMNGWYPASSNTPSFVSWMFKRAPSVFDVVAYTGSVSSQNISHNLSAQPEIIFIKNRTYGGNPWVVQVKNLGARKYLLFNSQGAIDLPTGSGTDFFTNTLPTSSVFTVGGGTEGGGYDSVGAANQNYIAYLFASLPGVSKVGSYSGTGGSVNVDCGFSAGARFVLIKRTDSSGDWYVWDSARGIVSGNDPYLLLNSPAAEEPNTDYIDPLSSGFTVTSSAPAALNASGGSYIFLAIS